MMPRINNHLLFISLILFLTGGCNSVYTSKKAGYFKIEFPQRNYLKFEKPGFPYSFEYPQYANIVRDTAFFDASSAGASFRVLVKSLDCLIPLVILASYFKKAIWSKI